MEDLKEQLLQLIEAYAAARSTNNELLIRGAANGLQQLLEGVELQPIAVSTPDSGDTVTEPLAA